jgi:hypothetical protein
VVYGVKEENKNGGIFGLCLVRIGKIIFPPLPEAAMRKEIKNQNAKIKTVELIRGDKINRKDGRTGGCNSKNSGVVKRCS